MLEPDNAQGITIKAKLILKDPSDEAKLHHTMEQYRQACNFISQYVFDNDFPMNQLKIQKEIYRDIREQYGLKSMMAQSAIRCTIARYKAVREQLFQNPHTFQDIYTEEYHTVYKDLRWLRKPVRFHRPQVDLVRNRDWSKLTDGTLSINTLDGRVLATPICSENFDKYFDGNWKLGGAKLLQNQNGQWMLHISATKQIDELEMGDVKHVVGIDRGLRFLAAACDEKGKVSFASGKEIMRKRDQFAKTRERLQKKHTWSAKRALKRIENRENRWMTDINHQLSKTLVKRYGEGTLFVLEDLTGVSFDENLNKRGKSGKRQLRSWAFYQFEQFLTYKAKLAGGDVIKVSANYTSQRCPKCGGIHKEFRRHDTHEYVCENCGYRANDDLTGARNIYLLGTLYVSGVENPKFGKPKTKAKTKAKEKVAN